MFVRIYKNNNLLHFCIWKRNLVSIWMLWITNNICIDNINYNVDVTRNSFLVMFTHNQYVYCAPSHVECRFKVVNKTNLERINKQ